MARLTYVLPLAQIVSNIVDKNFFTSSGYSINELKSHLEDIFVSLMRDLDKQLLPTTSTSDVVDAIYNADVYCDSFTYKSMLCNELTQKLDLVNLLSYLKRADNEDTSNYEVKLKGYSLALSVEKL